MEKLKNLFKVTATNKMMWVTLGVAVVIIIGTIATVYGISYVKSKEVLASVEEVPEDAIKQEDLVDTSQMSQEELQKLSEEDAKKAEEKEKEENEKKGKTTTNTKNKYYIKVNYGAQVVNIYTYDKNGNYTIPVRACICSTGAATPTSGVYRIGWKAVWGLLYGNVWGHYSCQVAGDILFHSVPYNQNRNDTLVSTYYDRLGSKDSMGCIRLTTIDAKWIYDNCPSGTQVEFYYSSDPGPFGKPSAIKVSNAPGNLKNWDPTDPDPKNPWIDYLKKQKEKEEQEKAKQNNTNNTTNGNTSANNTTGNNTTGNSTNSQNNENTNTQTQTVKNTYGEILTNGRKCK